jgi:DNA-binding response OmpR family regulator
VARNDDKKQLSSWITSLRARRDRAAERGDESDTARADGLVTEAAPATAGKLEVLLVENNVFVGEFVRHAVHKLGHELAFDGQELIVSRSAEDALVQLAARRPRVIVVDHQSGDLTDCSLVRRIRALPEHAMTPLLMLSTGGEEVRRAACEAGVTVYVEKPIQLTRLSATLRALLARPSAHDEPVSREALRRTH